MVQALRCKSVRFLASALVMALTLGGCYFPILFDIEIELDRSGYYSIIFDGYLAKVELYDAIRLNKITPAEEKERVAAVKTDLTRDSALKDFKYFKQGRFKVHWEKNGDLLRSKMVTFLRRNEKMLSLKYVKSNGLITMEGAAVPKSAYQQLADMGLNMQGQIRIITKARIVDHNATQVKGKIKGRGEKTLTWKIKSITDATPRAVLSLR